MADVAKGRDGEEEGRKRSTIAFPYEDLESAVQMAQAIQNNVGSGDCADDQLAAWTKQSAKSSGYRTQLSAARMFGAIESVSGRHRLTALGRMLIDPKRAREARARAFLNVPLYTAVFERYRGGVVPPAAALERDMVGMGVAEKMKDRARRVLERSADQAAFYEQGRDRLILPGVASRSDTPEDEGEDAAGGNGGGDGNGAPPDVDPIIQGLLARLPKSGETWPEAERKLWLQLLEGSFKLIYKDADA
jgi:hypothetical protein